MHLKHLEYLWVQLDQNIERPDSKTPLIESQNMDKAISTSGFAKNIWEVLFKVVLISNMLKMLKEINEIYHQSNHDAYRFA